MSLRSEAIEAMARTGYRGDAWESATDMERIVWWNDAERELDALLDYLTANVPMWSDGEGHPYCQTAHGSAAECHCPPDDFVRWLISVVRVEEGDNK